MDQAVLDQEGDMNTFNNRIYRITTHNLILKAIKWKPCSLVFRCPVACGCAAPSAERFMLIAESRRVHLHGVVTRDVRLSFKNNTKVFFKVKILDIQLIFTLRITAIRHGELKPRSPV